jgi:STE24 endopeptidase
VKFAGLCRWLLLSAILAAMLASVPGRAQSASHTGTAPSAAPTAKAAGHQDAYSLPPDLLAKAIALDRIRNVLAFGGALWGIAFLWLLLATRAAANVDRWTQRIATRRWLQGLIFFALFLIAVFLAGLPFDWFAHYTSRNYGISVQSWPSWLQDEGTSLALSLLIGTPLLLFFNWIVRRWPRRYWFVAWLITLPLMLIAVIAQPLVIDPLFNKFEPLQKSDPALVQQLEKVVQRTGIDIPPSRMFLMKASAKTNGLNAYVTGIGPTKRIVVWDTTAGRIPNDEILYIFAHETGHYVLHHIPKGLSISAVSIFFIFWICAAVAAWLVRSRGPRWQIDSLSTRAGFVILLFVLSVAGFVIEPAGNAVSRHFEHQADVYGQEAIHGIVANPQQTAVAAFNALGRAWLENPHPSAFSEFWLDSHPSIHQRASFAAHYDPWKNGGYGRFFKN